MPTNDQKLYILKNATAPLITPILIAFDPEMVSNLSVTHYFNGTTPTSIIPNCKIQHPLFFLHLHLLFIMHYSVSTHVGLRITANSDGPSPSERRKAGIYAIPIFHNTQSAF